jgi:hypothetical protein
MPARSRHRAYVAAALAFASPFVARSPARAGDPPSEARTPPPAAAPRVYFGNLHSHTSYSDGSGTPTEAFEHAKAAGLDFLAVTEHKYKSAEGSGESDPGPVPIHIARDHALYNGAGAADLMPVAFDRTGMREIWGTGSIGVDRIDRFAVVPSLIVRRRKP